MKDRPVFRFKRRDDTRARRRGGGPKTPICASTEPHSSNTSNFKDITGELGVNYWSKFGHYTAGADELGGAARLGDFCQQIGSSWIRKRNKNKKLGEKSSNGDETRIDVNDEASGTEHNQAGYKLSAKRRSLDWAETNQLQNSDFWRTEPGGASESFTSGDREQNRAQTERPRDTAQEEERSWVKHSSSECGIPESPIFTETTKAGACRVHVTQGVTTNPYVTVTRIAGSLKSYAIAALGLLIADPFPCRGVLIIEVALVEATGRYTRRLSFRRITPAPVVILSPLAATSFEEGCQKIISRSPPNTEVLGMLIYADTAAGPETFGTVTHGAVHPDAVSHSSISTFTVTLTLDFPSFLDHVDWAYLNTTLETYPQFATLQRLLFIVYCCTPSVTDTMEGAIRTRYQEYDARGLWM
ncbi:hypothetical protein B0H11DRAFT_1899502 [Mycena galericulata]|nr:hypothetical protein B0H11DRAFT_1899502 [Mycena galericulata]